MTFANDKRVGHHRHHHHQPQTLQSLFLSSLCLLLTTTSLTVVPLLPLATAQPSNQRSDQIIDGMHCSVEQSELSCLANLSDPTVAQILQDGLKTTDRYPNEIERFRVVDLVFTGGNILVDSKFFDAVENLYFDAFEREPQHLAPLEFRVKFQNFDQLQIGPAAFSEVFPKTYRNPEGNGPSRKLQMVVNVYNSKAATTHISEEVFDDLSVSALTIHNADLSSVDFERLFAKSIIKTLDLKGSYIQSRNGDPDHFSGKVDEVILIKQAAGLDSNEFPKYPVKSYTLIAQNIRRIDGNSLRNHSNVRELQIKSKNCSLKNGDLTLLPNLRNLTLEGVIVEPNAFANLDKLENVHIGEGVSLEPDDLKQLMNLPNINHLVYNPRLDELDETTRCDVITSLSSNHRLRHKTKFELKDTREGCSCEHTMIANLGTSIDDVCYQADEALIARCLSSPCSAVRKFFEEMSAGVAATLPSPDVGGDDRAHHHHNHYSQQHDTSQRVHLAQEIDDEDEDDPHHNDIQEDLDIVSEERVINAPIGSTSTAAAPAGHVLLTPAVPAEPEIKKSKFNWLPIIVILSVAAALILIGALVFLVRKRRERNREFKPIPTSESAAAAAKR